MKEIKIVILGIIFFVVLILYALSFICLYDIYFNDGKILNKGIMRIPERIDKISNK